MGADMWDITRDKERKMGLKRERGMPYNPYGGLVDGRWYKVITSNSEFEFWYPHKIKRSELKKAALEFIGRGIYQLDDIDSVREIKSSDVGRY